MNAGGDDPLSGNWALGLGNLPDGRFAESDEHLAGMTAFSSCAGGKGLIMPGFKLPEVCDFSVTNVCNAACGFCGFARDKTLTGPARYADAGAFSRALPTLHRRGIRYMTLQGGEPLVHAEIVRLVRDTAASGISCAIITNGWFLPRFIAPLAEAGLSRLIISLDSATLAEHERNRGLSGLEGRMREGIARAHDYGLPVQASVTVSRLVRYDDLPDTLERLGFDAVSFSYPRTDPLGSTSLVYGAGPEIELDRDELLAALDAIGRLRQRFPVLNPRASLAEVGRFVRGEPQAIPCIGGHKYFYLDWNLDIWRCEAWHQPLGSVFDLDGIPDQRDPCNACIMGCYRNASMLMHAAVATASSVEALAAGRVGAAVAHLFRPGVARSLRSLIEQAGMMRRMARRPRAARRADRALGQSTI
ncbi:MAG TPA: radical SAM protein [Stellaceae bacterium]|nr:radical SAM protein [Stellaceae bacterium]